MTFEVFIIKDAEDDLFEIYNYISKNDSPNSAVYVIKKIQNIVESLQENPKRGSIPGELEQIGTKEFRELFFKPYRIIYKVKESNVFVMLIVDGRRSLQTILARRLLSE